MANKPIKLYVLRDYALSKVTTGYKKKVHFKNYN